MPDIHLQRDHSLGLAEARKLAERWAGEAQQKFDMDCRYEAGEACDTLSFSRAGVSGTLQVTAEQFALDAKLGFLLGAFKERIEEEIAKNLDALLQAAPQGGDSR